MPDLYSSCPRLLMLILASIQQSTMIGFSCTQFWLCHFHIAVSNTLKHPLFIVYFWSACFTACSHQNLTKLKNVRCVSYCMKSSSKPLRNKNVHHVSQNDIDMIFALKLLHFSISYRFFFLLIFLQVLLWRRMYLKI